MRHKFVAKMGNSGFLALLLDVLDAKNILLINTGSA
jgi:hypothetical protein